MVLPPSECVPAIDLSDARRGRFTVRRSPGWSNHGWGTVAVPVPAAPLASTLGVSFAELNAALAAVTQQGVPTAQAATQIRAALQGLVRGTPEVVAALGEFATVSESIKGVGLAETFNNVRIAAGTNEAELIRLVGSIEGLGAILALTGKNFENFQKRLKDQETRFGAITEASEEVRQSFGIQLQITITRLSNAFVELGEVVIPAVAPIVQLIGDMALAFQELSKTSEVFQLFIKGVAVLGVLASILGTLGIIVFALGRGFFLLKGAFKAFGLNVIAARAGLQAATFWTRAWAVSINLLKAAFGPVGIALTLLTVAMVAFGDETEEMNEELEIALDNLETLSNLETITTFSDLNEESVKLTKQLAAQTAHVQRMRDEIESGSFKGFLTTAFGALPDALEDLEAIRLKLEQVGGASETLSAKMEDLAFAVQFAATDADFSALVRAAEVQEQELDEILGNIGRTRQLFLLEKPEVSVPQSRRAIAAGAPERRVTKEGEDINVITAGEQKYLDVLQAQLEAGNLRLDNLIKVRDAAQALRDEDDAQRKAREESATERLTLRQRVKAAREAASLLQAENRLRQSEDKKVADAAIAANELLADEVENSFEKRLISAEEYYAELERLANANKAIEQKLLEDQLADVEAQREAALKTAKATEDASPAELARIDAQFAAQRVAIQANLAKLDQQLTADLQDLGQNASTAAIDAIGEAVDRILQDQQFRIQIVQAKVETGTISPTIGQKEIAEATAAANVELEKQLVLIEALLAANPEDPVLVEMAQRVRIAIEETNEAVTIFAQRLTSITQGELSEFFDEILSGSDDVAKSFDELIIGIGEKIRKLIADRLAQKLIDSLFGGIIGEGSVIGGFLGSGGGYIQAADGGYIQPTGSRSGTRRIIHAAKGGLIETSEGEVEYIPAPKPKYKKAKSGGIMKMSTGGGRVRGRGTATSDHVGPVFLSNGEYVVKTAAVRHYGINVIEAINQMKLDPLDVKRKLTITKPRRTSFQTGGLVGDIPSASTAASAAVRAGGGSMKLEVSEGALNLTMRDFLEREFGRIMATR